MPTSIQVSPSQASLDASHLTLMNAVLGADNILRTRIRPYGSNIVGGQFAFDAAFGAHIAHIVRVRTGEQVCWIYAGWVVAAVKDVCALRYRANKDNVGNPVRVLLQAELHLAISTILEALKHPALGGRINDYTFMQLAALPLWIVSVCAMCYRRLGHIRNLSFLCWLGSLGYLQYLSGSPHFSTPRAAL